VRSPINPILSSNVKVDHSVSPLHYAKDMKKACSFNTSVIQRFSLKSSTNDITNNLNNLPQSLKSSSRQLDGQLDSISLRSDNISESWGKENEEKEEEEFKQNKFSLRLSHEMVQPIHSQGNRILQTILSESSNKISSSDLRMFLIKPLEKDNWVKCFLEKRVEKKINKFYLYLTVNDGNKFLMSAIKNPKKSSSRFILSMNEEPSLVKNEKYLGKLCANFFGTEFNIYDNGKKPGKSSQSCRNNIGGIAYV
jgi:hypothetical protein